MRHELIPYKSAPTDQGNNLIPLILMFSPCVLVAYFLFLFRFRNAQPDNQLTLSSYENVSMCNSGNTSSLRSGSWASFFSKANALIRDCLPGRRREITEKTLHEQYMELLDEQELETLEIIDLMREASDISVGLTNELQNKISTFVQKHEAGIISDTSIGIRQDEMFDSICQLLNSYPELDPYNQPLTDDKYRNIIQERTEHHQQLTELVTLYLKEESALHAEVRKEMSLA